MSPVKESSWVSPATLLLLKWCGGGGFLARNQCYPPETGALSLHRQQSPVDCLLAVNRGALSSLPLGNVRPGSVVLPGSRSLGWPPPGDRMGFIQLRCHLCRSPLCFGVESSSDTWQRQSGLLSLCRHGESIKLSPCCPLLIYQM